MIRFLRKLSKPLKYGASIIAGGSYIWAIIYLAKSDNWVGISALTTMLLAIAAFWNIRQTYGMRKAEKRERLLNEIIEWAIEITHANFGGEIIVTSGISEKIQRRRDSANRLLNCQELTLKGEELIKQFALSVNNELSDAVSEVIKSLNVVTGILSRGIPYNESEEAKDLLKSNDTVLDQSIRSLFKKVSIYRI